MCGWLIMSLYSDEQQRFKKALKEYRAANGYKQKEMAKVLGVPEGTYISWEKKGTIPRMPAFIEAIEKTIGFKFKMHYVDGFNDSIVQYIKDHYLEKSINELAMDTGYAPRMVYNILSLNDLTSPFDFIQGANICFDCVNAVPTKDGTRGCNWSRYFRPVKGWTATKAPFKAAYTHTWTYHITECPEFEKG